MSEKKIFGVGFRLPITSLHPVGSQSSGSKRPMKGKKDEINRNLKTSFDDISRGSQENIISSSKEAYGKVTPPRDVTGTGAKSLSQKTILESSTIEKLSKSKSSRVEEIPEDYTHGYTSINSFFERDTSEPIIDPNSDLGKAFSDVHKHVQTAMIRTESSSHNPVSQKASVKNISGKKKR